VTTALPTLHGRVAFVFAEDDFDIDQIVGVSNIKLQDPEALARVAMSRFDPEFRSRVRPGDLLVGGRNFGYGHPHYQAMKAMRHMGIAGVVAESFFPIYWQGEIGMGFPQVACPGIAAAVERWDPVEVSWERGVVRLPRTGAELPFEPYADAEREMLLAGGFGNRVRETLRRQRDTHREK
jgi:3-isopropylmalate/(R)-2-methylmalate dehydratase small subunit